MTGNLVPLDVGYRPVNVAPLVEVARGHAQIWEEENFDGLPSILENLERYKRLLGRCLDETIVAAQQLEAKLAARTFSSIIEVWTPEDNSDLLAVAEQERQRILALLDSQILFLNDESRALCLLPEFNGTTDRACLYATLISRTERTDIRTETAERMEADLQKALRAFDTLESSRLSLHFEGRIPSVEALIQASASNALDLLVPIGTIVQAVSDLEATLGKSLAGLSHAELVDEIDQLIKRVSEARSDIAQLAYKQAAVKASLAALDRLESLTLQRCQWKGAVTRLVHALAIHSNLLTHVPAQSLSDVARLDGICNELLRFEQHVLAQLTL